jgi:two-component system sensor histidine kinase CpxA
VKLRMPLYAQIFSMLFLYVITLGVLVFASLNTQFGFGWDALIKSPLGDRVNTVADAITGQLKASPMTQWNAILSSFGKLHHVKFYLFDVLGNQLAGEPITIPQELDERLPEFRPHFGGPMHLGPRGGVDGKSNGISPFLNDDDRDMRGGHQNGMSAGRMPPDGLPPDGRLPDGMLPDGPPPDGMSSGGKPLDSRPPNETPSDRKPPDARPDWDSPQERRHFFRNGRHFEPPRELSHAHGQFFVYTRNPGRSWICSRVLFMPEGSRHHIPAVIIALSNNIWQNNLLFDSTFILQSAAVVLLLSLAFWWPFIHSISKALSNLTVATESIAEGHFDTRLKVNRRDEIGRLSDAVNTMAEKLTNFVTGQKRFLGDISHELFTPIARLQMALELLDEDASENQTALIQDIREEIQEMTSLVNELLAFSKAGLKGTEPEISVVKPRILLQDLITRLNLSDRVALNVSEQIEVTADPLLLSRAFSNVLRNSVRYAGDSGPITISTVEHTNQISILISDCGPGVPEEALKRLAEPFFRPEASRSRSSGGVGLGLAIVKSCIEACNGALHLRNRPQGGFEVEIRLNRP